MRIVIQRTRSASVMVNGQTNGKIDKGLVVLLGIEATDEKSDADWLIKKTLSLRIFSDSEGKMNLSLPEVNGNILVISQFTLHASTKKGNRPSYINAARPEIAIPLYNYFIEELKRSSGLDIQTGIFGADMQVSLINDGPVTILMDSKNKE
ncbi:MAG: D-aminoacyl-tRNA deacylase [Crocinitomicaceae bacterium]|nr:D-aminoacyl-tRNA deacylase [Crocinitomicaceae bacterium]